MALACIPNTFHQNLSVGVKLLCPAYSRSLRRQYCTGSFGIGLPNREIPLRALFNE